MGRDGLRTVAAALLALPAVRRDRVRPGGREEAAMLGVRQRA